MHHDGASGKYNAVLVYSFYVERNIWREVTSLALSRTSYLDEAISHLPFVSVGVD
jgi:hypothetical protein